MSSHLFDDREASPSDFDDKLLNKDVQLILARLCSKPGLQDAITKTRAWSRDAWFTSDGVSFYHRRADTEAICFHLPAVTKEEVVLYAQATFRILFQHVCLFDDHLAPKIEKIMKGNDSDFSKVDKIYWLRHRYPIIVGSKVPVIRNGRVTGFCWGWDLDRETGLPPSPSRLQSDEFITNLLGLPSLIR